MDPHIFFAILVQLYCKFLDVGGDQVALCTLDGWVLPREVVNDEVMSVPQEISIHHGCGGS